MTHPPFDEERAAILKRVADRLFPHDAVFRLTEDEMAKIEYVARSIHSNPYNNVTGKSYDLTYKHTSRGLIVEQGARELLGVPRHIPTSIDIRRPRSYNHDVPWEDLMIEVKSISTEFRDHENASYNATSASTLFKNLHDISVIAFGIMYDLGDRFYKVDFRWVVTPFYFKEPYIRRSGDYYRLDPHKTVRVREPDACVWNRRLLTGLEFGVEETA